MTGAGAGGVLLESLPSNDEYERIGERAERSHDGRVGPPFEIETIESRDSEAGTVTIPDPERVIVLNFTRTACPSGVTHLETLASAVGSVDGDVRLLSLVNPAVDPADGEAAFASWWDEHPGTWGLAIDDDGSIFAYYDVEAMPTTTVLDGTGTAHWRNTGNVTSDAVVDGIEDAKAVWEGE